MPRHPEPPPELMSWVYRLRGVEVIFVELGMAAFSVTVQRRGTAGNRALVHRLQPLNVLIDEERSNQSLALIVR